MTGLPFSAAQIVTAPRHFMQNCALSSRFVSMEGSGGGSIGPYRTCQAAQDRRCGGKPRDALVFDECKGGAKTPEDCWGLCRLWLAVIQTGLKSMLKTVSKVRLLVNTSVVPARLGLKALAKAQLRRAQACRC